MVKHLEKSGQFLTEDEHFLRVRHAYECSYLIHVNGTRIGAIKYHDSSASVEIFQLQIHPDVQGQGYGRRIIEYIMANTRAKTIKLSVLKENPALHLYHRLGFEIVDEDNFEFYMRKLIPTNRDD